MNGRFARAVAGLFSMILTTTISAQVARPAPISSGTPASSKVVLVELFTSEGCSSCPPADALLRKINGTHTASGQLIVGISEHVTYWNSLGWSDPFSSPLYTERAEKAAVIVTTNLPFSEWPQVFTNARLCKAMLDRLTDQAHIIETGSESYRFRRTLRKKKE